jgi:hypothetical protein
MKTPKLIIAALVSGRVKLTPEVLDVLKKHRHDEKVSETKDSPTVEESPTPVTTPAADGRDVSPERPSAGGSGRLGEASLPQQALPQSGCTPSAPPTGCSRRRMFFASPLPGRWIRVCGMALGCVAVWLAHPMSTRAQDSDFDAANRASAEGKWAEAARGFESVIARHGYSAPALFNLANAQVREGKLGPAILNYERARWLAPTDPDIAANLHLARQKAGLEPETLSRFSAVAHSMTITGWSMLAAAMLWLIMAALPLRQVLPRISPTLTIGAILGTAVFLAAVGALVLRWPDLHRGIVTAAEAPARVSPVTVIQPQFTLRAGEAVTVKGTYGAFLLISNQHGREGWVSCEAVAPVVNVGRAG